MMPMMADPAMNQLEEILPRIADFDITLPESPTIHYYNNASASNTDVGSKKPRYYVLKGERLKVQLRIRPPNPSQLDSGISSPASARGSLSKKEVFKPLPIDSLKTFFDLTSEAECLQCWRHLFSELYVDIAVTNALPLTKDSILEMKSFQPKKSPRRKQNQNDQADTKVPQQPQQQPMISTTAAEQSQQPTTGSSAANIDMSYIESYVLRNKAVNKVSVHNSSETLAKYTKNEELSTESEFVFDFEVDLDEEHLPEIDSQSYFVTLSIYMATDKYLQYNTDFERGKISSLVFMPHQNGLDDELNFLLPYATSKSLTSMKLHVCDVCKPVCVVDLLQVTSQDMLIERKNYICMTLENVNPEHAVTVKNMTFHLVTSRLAQQHRHNLHSPRRSGSFKKRRSISDAELPVGAIVKPNTSSAKASNLSSIGSGTRRSINRDKNTSSDIGTPRSRAKNLIAGNVADNLPPLSVSEDAQKPVAPITIDASDSDMQEISIVTARGGSDSPTPSDPDSPSSASGSNTFNNKQSEADGDNPGSSGNKPARATEIAQKRATATPSKLTPIKTATPRKVVQSQLDLNDARQRSSRALSLDDDLHKAVLNTTLSSVLSHRDVITSHKLKMANIMTNEEIVNQFDVYYDRSQFPVPLLPLEQHAFFFIVSPVENYSRSSNSGSNTASAAPSTAVATRISDTATNSIKGSAGDVLSTFETLVTTECEVKGLQHPIVHKHFVKWTCVRRDALFVAMQCSPIAYMYQPFVASVMIINQSLEDVDLMVSIDMENEDKQNPTLICQEASLSIGLVPVNSSVNVNIHIFALKEGLCKIGKVILHNKKTGEEFATTSSCEILVLPEQHYR